VDFLLRCIGEGTGKALRHDAAHGIVDGRIAAIARRNAEAEAAQAEAASPPPPPVPPPTSTVALAPMPPQAPAPQEPMPWPDDEPPEEYDWQRRRDVC
jgi:hypothetical protein